MKTIHNRSLRNFRPALLLGLTFLLTVLFAATAGAKVIKPTGITAVGSKTVNMTVGEERDLKVRVTPINAEDDYLDWEIVSGSKVVAFTDYDREGDDIEVRALKAGSAKVRCTIAGNTKKKVTFKITVKKAPASSTITAVGETARTVYVGDDFELKVKKSAGLKDRYLEWKIADEKILRFEDYYETTGDDVELWALKAGTTKVTCTNTQTDKKVTFQVTVKKAASTITRNGPKTRTVELGDDFELEVNRKSASVSNRNLQWKISNTKIAGFADYETWGDEVEFWAKKTGTVTITCTNTDTGEKVDFTVNVVPFYDDDYDDD